MKIFCGHPVTTPILFLKQHYFLKHELLPGLVSIGLGISEPSLSLAGGVGGGVEYSARATVEGEFSVVEVTRSVLPVILV